MKKLWLFGLFSGDKGDIIDMWMIKIQTKGPQNSCAADEQACVFGSCAFNKHSILKIFIIDGLNFQTV